LGDFWVIFGRFLGDFWAIFGRFLGDFLGDFCNNIVTKMY
jgi:hypothetical protein